MREVSAFDITGNVFDMIFNGKAILTVKKGDIINSMTISWGALGYLWKKPTATMYLRPQRYTCQLLMDGCDSYTLSFLGSKYEKEIERAKGDLEKYPEGKVVSGAFVVTYLDKAYYLYGANITDDGGLNANKALVSWIMQTLYDEKGIRSFDFFGVSEDQEHHGGINGFKQSFDPELVEYIGEFDMPISKFWFELFHTWAPKAVSLKNKILVRRKK